MLIYKITYTAGDEPVEAYISAALRGAMLECKGAPAADRITVMEKLLGRNKGQLLAEITDMDVDAERFNKTFAGLLICLSATFSPALENCSTETKNSNNAGVVSVAVEAQTISTPPQPYFCTAFEYEVAQYKEDHLVDLPRETKADEVLVSSVRESLRGDLFENDALKESKEFKADGAAKDSLSFKYAEWMNAKPNKKETKLQGFKTAFSAANLTELANFYQRLNQAGVTFQYCYFRLKGKKVKISLDCQETAILKLQGMSSLYHENLSGLKALLPEDVSKSALKIYARELQILRYCANVQTSTELETFVADDLDSILTQISSFESALTPAQNGGAAGTDAQTVMAEFDRVTALTLTLPAGVAVDKVAALKQAQRNRLVELGRQGLDIFESSIAGFIDMSAVISALELLDQWNLNAESTLDGQKARVLDKLAGRALELFEQYLNNPAACNQQTLCANLIAYLDYLNQLEKYDTQSVQAFRATLWLMTKGELASTTQASDIILTKLDVMQFLGESYIEPIYKAYAQKPSVTAYSIIQDLKGQLTQLAPVLGVGKFMVDSYNTSSGDTDPAISAKINGIAASIQQAIADFQTVEWLTAEIGLQKDIAQMFGQLHSPNIVESIQARDEIQTIRNELEALFNAVPDDARKPIRNRFQDFLSYCDSTHIQPAVSANEGVVESKGEIQLPQRLQSAVVANHAIFSRIPKTLDQTNTYQMDETKSESSPTGTVVGARMNLSSVGSDAKSEAKEAPEIKSLYDQNTDALMSLLQTLARPWVIERMKILVQAVYNYNHEYKSANNGFEALKKCDALNTYVAQLDYQNLKILTETSSDEDVIAHYQFVMGAISVMGQVKKCERWKEGKASKNLPPMKQVLAETYQYPKGTSAELLLPTLQSRLVNEAVGPRVEKINSDLSPADEGQGVEGSAHTQLTEFKTRADELCKSLIIPGQEAQRINAIRTLARECHEFLGQYADDIPVFSALGQYPEKLVPAIHEVQAILSSLVEREALLIPCRHLFECVAVLNADFEKMPLDKKIQALQAIAAVDTELSRNALGQTYLQDVKFQGVLQAYLNATMTQALKEHALLTVFVSGPFKPYQDLIAEEIRTWVQGASPSAGATTGDLQVQAAVHQSEKAMQAAQAAEIARLNQSIVELRATNEELFNAYRELQQTPRRARRIESLEDVISVGGGSVASSPARSLSTTKFPMAFRDNSDSSQGASATKRAAKSQPRMITVFMGEHEGFQRKLFARATYEFFRDWSDSRLVELPKVANRDQFKVKLEAFKRLMDVYVATQSSLQRSMDAPIRVSSQSAGLPLNLKAVTDEAYSAAYDLIHWYYTSREYTDSDHEIALKRFFVSFGLDVSMTKVPERSWPDQLNLKEHAISYDAARLKMICSFYEMMHQALSAPTSEESTDSKVVELERKMLLQYSVILGNAYPTDTAARAGLKDMTFLHKDGFMGGEMMAKVGLNEYLDDACPQVLNLDEVMRWRALLQSGGHMLSSKDQHMLYRRIRGLIQFTIENRDDNGKLLLTSAKPRFLPSDIKVGEDVYKTAQGRKSRRAFLALEHGIICHVMNAADELQEAKDGASIETVNEEPFTIEKSWVVKHESVAESSFAVIKTPGRPVKQSTRQLSSPESKDLLFSERRFLQIVAGYLEDAEAACYGFPPESSNVVSGDQLQNLKAMWESQLTLLKEVQTRALEVLNSRVTNAEKGASLKQILPGLDPQLKVFVTLLMPAVRCLLELHNLMSRSKALNIGCQDLEILKSTFDRLCAEILRRMGSESLLSSQEEYEHVVEQIGNMIAQSVSSRENISLLVTSLERQKALEAQNAQLQAETAGSQAANTQLQRQLNKQKNATQEAQKQIDAAAKRVEKLKRKNAKLLTELGALRDQIPGLRSELQTITTANQALQQELAQAQADKSTLTQQVQDARSEAQSLQGQLDLVTQEKAALQAEIAQLQVQLSSRPRAASPAGSQFSDADTMDSDDDGQLDVFPPKNISSTQGAAPGDGSDETKHQPQDGAAAGAAAVGDTPSRKPSSEAGSHGMPSAGNASDPSLFEAGKGTPRRTAGSFASHGSGGRQTFFDTLGSFEELIQSNTSDSENEGSGFGVDD